MIRLKKGKKPSVLEVNAEAWTKKILDEISKGRKQRDYDKKRYNHPDIKNCLLEEANHKCAYCESRFQHVGFGHIDHIAPKSKNPHLTFEWDNLTISCEVCNIKKADSEGVIHPYKDDPDEHIFFEGAALMVRPGSDLGYNTEKIIKLNRDDLLDLRKNRMNNICSLLKILEDVTNPTKREVIVNFLKEKETAPSAEYAAMSRTIISHWLEKMGL